MNESRGLALIAILTSVFAILFMAAVVISYIPENPVVAFAAVLGGLVGLICSIVIIWWMENDRSDRS